MILIAGTPRKFHALLRFINVVQMQIETMPKTIKTTPNSSKTIILLPCQYVNVNYVDYREKQLKIVVTT